MGFNTANYADYGGAGKSARFASARFPGWFAYPTQCWCAKIASSSSATILVILIAGLTAGPAVSL